MRRRTLTIASLATLLMGVAATQALGTVADPVVAIDDTDFSMNGAIDVSGEGVFDNQDTVTHNVTADAKGPDGKPLFRSGNTPG